MSDSLSFPARQVPVLAEYDVLVAGSGSAGVCAAISAARMGARVAIVEAFPNVGGTAASGLPLLTTNDNAGTQLSRGILQEIMEGLRRESAFDADLARDRYFCYDVDKYRLLVTRMLQAVGVDIRTFTTIVGVEKNGERLTHLFVHQKEGFAGLSAKAFVDCSGDADVAHFCGEPMLANDIDGNPQPPTLLFFAAGFGNVDFSDAAWTNVQNLWDETRAAHRWINPRRGPALSPPFSYPGKPGFHGFNVTRSLGIDPTKTADLVRMEIEQREQVDEFFYQFLKPMVPGCDKAFLTGTHFISGIRESRRIRGDFVLAVEALRRHEEFPDAVAWSSYPIDRHSPRQGTTILHRADISAYYSVPFRVMVPAKTPNLLVSGRCISADELAFSAVRVMGTTMLLGEAAGIGAAMMARTGMSARDLPIEELRGELRRRGTLVERQTAAGVRMATQPSSRAME